MHDTHREIAMPHGRSSDGSALMHASPMRHAKDRDKFERRARELRAIAVYAKRQSTRDQLHAFAEEYERMAASLVAEEREKSAANVIQASRGPRLPPG
jgi:hypothetical protein